MERGIVAVDGGGVGKSFHFQSIGWEIEMGSG